MPAPNLFLIYVRDAENATAFYSDLFEIKPTFTRACLTKVASIG